MVTGEVSSRSVYSGWKNKTFNELELELDRGGGVDGAVMVGVMVETWLCGSLLPVNYDEEQSLKGIRQRSPC